MIKAAAFILILFLSLAVKGEKLSIQDHSRYAENPIYIFFEGYIQDVIGYLPEEKSNSLQGMNLQKIFNTEATEWRSAIKETLNLSDTIDIAILDLWYRNREQFKSDNGEYDPVWFSQIFTDEYVKEGSQVDVWLESTLESAKMRIKTAQE